MEDLIDKSRGKWKHGLTRHALYSIWSINKHKCSSRCKNNYMREIYFERGIKVCNEWMEFINFYNWAMNNGYKKGLTLDRINNNGDYEPFNCRFTTYSIQNGNKRKYNRLPRNYRDFIN